MPARSPRISHNLDVPTVVLFLLLAGLGWWNLISASTGLDGPVEWSLGTLHGKQALWLMASLVIGALILQVEGEFFIRTAWINYAVQILLCASVLVIGKKVGGARSWFGVGGFGIQPSEFAKLGTAMALAWLEVLAWGMSNLDMSGIDGNEGKTASGVGAGAFFTVKSILFS